MRTINNNNNMLRDNSLEERLNAIKQGEEIPVPSTNKQNPIIQKPKEIPKPTYIVKYSYILESLISSLFYGFAIKTIFGLDWTMFGAFTVGFLFNHAISIFPKYLFPKYFNK